MDVMQQEVSRINYQEPNLHLLFVKTWYQGIKENFKSKLIPQNTVNVYYILCSWYFQIHISFEWMTEETLFSFKKICKDGTKRHFRESERTKSFFTSGCMWISCKWYIHWRWLWSRVLILPRREWTSHNSFLHML